MTCFRACAHEQTPRAAAHVSAHHGCRKRTHSEQRHEHTQWSMMDAACKRRLAQSVHMGAQWLPRICRATMPLRCATGAGHHCIGRTQGGVVCEGSLINSAVHAVDAPRNGEHMQGRKKKKKRGMCRKLKSRRADACTCPLPQAHP